MRYYEISNVAFIIYFSVLAIVILYSLFPPTLINSQPEPASKPFNKCVDYHSSDPSDVGIVVGGHPSGLSIDPTNGKIYVVDSLVSKKISVIDGITDTVTKTISIAGMKPVLLGNETSESFFNNIARGYIAIDPVTNLLSVGSSYSPLLYVFDAESGNLVNNITLNSKSRGISANDSYTEVITTSTIGLIEHGSIVSSSLSSVYNFAGVIVPLMSSPENDNFNAIDFASNSSYIVGDEWLYIYDVTPPYPPLLVNYYNLPAPADTIFIPKLEDVAINPSTNITYMIQTVPTSYPQPDTYSNIITLDLTSNNTTVIKLPYHNVDGGAVAVNRNTNIIYALIHDPSKPHKVLAFDGITNCLLAEIPIGQNPIDLAVDSNKNMIYATNEGSGTVSAINGTTNNLTAVIRYEISPSNSGYIQCNEKRMQQNFTRYDIGTNLSCEAIPYSGYAFSSWSGDFVTSTFSRDPNVNSNPLIELKVSKYGTLGAHFITSNPLIPEQLWVPLYGIIPAVIVGTLIPSLLKWRKEKKISKRHLEYYRNLIGKTDDSSELEKEITQLYREAKINESDYASLKEGIKDHNDRLPEQDK